MLAGMDTTSNALSRTLQILSQNPEAQAKLRAEIVEARNGEPVIGYENLIKLPYLDAVCRETLRLYVLRLKAAHISSRIYSSSCRIVLI